jgi:hypothetical protein
MNTGKHIFTGTAGVYYVMHKLAADGIHASCTHGNAPNIDILASYGDGSRTVTIEVKTTEHAIRLKGRGAAKQPDHLEFPLGRRAAKLNHPALVIAFVDLRVFSADRVPDVYLYPSAVVADLCASWVDTVPMVRFHPPLAAAEPYKDRWDVIHRILDDVPPDSDDLIFERFRDDGGTYWWRPKPLTERGEQLAMSYASPEPSRIA